MGRKVYYNKNNHRNNNSFESQVVDIDESLPSTM